MCGICGVHGPHPDPVGATRTMMRALEHRGPDGRGLHTVGATTLGHTRLAVVDPEGGHQPHRDLRRGVALSANGEIYNHARLRAAFADADFASGADTEVALRLLDPAASGYPERLDGMFALAASDGRHLLLVRDPLGIKPLYRARHASGATLFASEAKALEPFDLPLEAVPPGTAERVDAGGEPTVAGETQVPPAAPELRAPEAAAAAVRDALDRAVRKRLMSDVPLGAFLSGGLDSSLVAALARRAMPELHTFAVGVPGSPDLRAARRVAEHLGTVHHEYALDAAEVRAALPGIVRALESDDVDLVRSCVPTYFTARLAREHVTVVLSGEGADELFGGYAYHAGYAPEALAPELTRSLGEMHGVNLQRVDRMTMAHGLEGRVPFLDRELVALAQRIDPRLKAFDAGGERVEKWILRRAASGLLPEDVVWRGKAQFDEGSGSKDLLAGADRGEEARRYRGLLEAGYAHPQRVRATVARWQDGRLGSASPPFSPPR